jgi:hypothetical protein
MALLTASLKRLELFQGNDIPSEDLAPFAFHEYLLGKIVKLSIPERVLVVDQRLLTLRDSIFHTFKVKHTLLIKGEEKSVDTTVSIDVFKSSVAIRITVLYDNKNEILNMHQNFLQLQESFLDICVFLKYKITFFMNPSSISDRFARPTRK